MAHRLAELAALVGGEVRGDPERRIEGVRPLAAAGPEHLSFLTHPKYRGEAARSRAGALLVGSRDRIDRLEGRDLLLSADPAWALARILAALHPETAPIPGVHATAVIGAGCEIHPSAHVGPLAVIGEGSRLEEGAVAHAHVVVGSQCRVGAGTVLHPHAVLYAGTEVGRACIVHAGVVLGSDGFGYATHQGEHVKVPQLGRVVVEDGVEIGANTTIDRATLDETRLGAGSKIDNLVQVGHNVRLGRGCILVSQSGIAGSSTLGDHVVLAGQAGVSGHLNLGAGVRVAAKSAVFRDVPAGHQVAGVPAVEAGQWRRQQALAGRLGELRRRLRELERRAGIGRRSGEEGEA